MKKRENHNSIVQVLKMGAALILALSSPLGPWSAASQPVQATGATEGSPPPTPPPPTERRQPLPPGWAAPPLNSQVLGPAGEELAVVQWARTATEDPARDVYNGETVTYTIALTNQSDTTLTNLVVVDRLPEDALDGIVCATSGGTACTLIYDEQEIPEPSGGTIVVQATRAISYPIPSLGARQPITLEFSGRVIGQPEGNELINYVRADYSGGSTIAQPLSLIAHVRIGTTGASVSAAPTWFSQDRGGTISQDWGDFDRDGDLDLALGSSLGTSAYHNEGGRLTQLWTNIPTAPSEERRLSYGVRWADMDQDRGQLELVTVGNSVDGSATANGVNYVYSFDQPSQKFVPTDVFTSEYQLVRVAPGDYDGDGDVDLVASTNAINVTDREACLVNLYRNDGTGHFTGTQALTPTHDIECLSRNATAALGTGDYDDDGDLDLVVGTFPNALRLLVNNGINDPYHKVITQANPFTATHPITIEDRLEYLPYDLAWGDYDDDGDLDLAAAYPLQREVRVYRNQASTNPLEPLVPIAPSLRTAPFMTPLSIDWGDFNGDGQLDLLVADSPPKIYQYEETTGRFIPIDSLSPRATSGRVWSIRGVDLTNKNNLDLAMSNQDGPSQLFPILAPNLKPTITPVSAQSAGSVAWGDADDDGDLDLLVGASDQSWRGSFLHINENGDFGTGEEFKFSTFGPHGIAFGDGTGDGWLDVAIGTPSGIQIYQSANQAVNPESKPAALGPNQAIHSLAWGDADDDGRLDLLVGQEDGDIRLYLNQGTGLTTTGAFTATADGDVRSLAWGDLNDDCYLDFATGVYGGGAQVYRNNGDGSFDLAWSSPGAAPTGTTAVAWADYDDDGDLDLAVGNDRAENYVWENLGGTFSASRVWISTDGSSRTTSLAWGDWNNDGYPELAVGNDGERDVVYANLDSEPGSPRLFALWDSAETAATTGVAWGDADGDGDLDLAISQRGGGHNGFYANTAMVPAHLPGHTAAPLPDASPYLYVGRPGPTADAYFYSSPAVLAGPGHPTVTIPYRLYDPEGDPVAGINFEYSLDGGSGWEPAKRASGSPVPITRTSPTGEPGTFIWDARANDAVSDDARFRIRVVHQNPVGPVQHASSTAVSPPFRVRAQDCFWPTGVSIAFAPPHPQPGDVVEFTGRVAYASGQLHYDWDFGDGGTSSGWVVTHTYSSHGLFIARLAVTAQVDEEICPVPRPGYARAEVRVGAGALGNRVYLPLVMRSFPTATAVAATAAPTANERTANASKPANAAPKPANAAAQSPRSPLAELPAGSHPSPRLQAAAAAPPGEATQVTQFALGVDSQPAVNQDGTRIAFWTTGRLTGQNDDGNIEIFLAEVQADGSVRYTQITSSTGSILGGFNLAPTIDDAGEHVAFFSDRDLVGLNGDHNFEIFVAEISPSLAITQVTRTPKGVNILPDISGNGRFIAFASDRDLTQTGHQKEGQAEIYRAEVQSTGTLTKTWHITYTRVTTTPITPQTGTNDQPAISRDGRFVAFVSDQDLDEERDNSDGNREIFLAEIGPSGALTYTQVTSSTGGINEQPAISADGTRIAFVSDRDLRPGENPGGTRQIFVGDFLTTTQAFRITRQIPESIVGSGPKDQPTISADGTRIAFISADDGQLHLYDYIEEEDKFEGSPGGHAHPSLSADGTGVVFVSNWDIYMASYPLADLAVSKSADRDRVKVGEPLTYTIVVTNNGPSPATDVLLTDVLSEGVEALLPPSVLDYTDDTEAEFLSGDPQHHHGTVWDASNEWLEMNATDNRFELPDDGGDVDSWTNMQHNALLLHLNDVYAYPDTSGNGNSIFCDQFGGRCPVPIAGRLGLGAQDFDGFDDYLDAGTGPAISNLGPGTWMMWVRRDAEAPGTLLYKGDPGSFDGWWIDFRSATELGFSGAIAGWDGRRYTRDIPGPGEWFHLAVTWDRSEGHQGIRIYINGQEATYSIQETCSFGEVPQTSLFIGTGGWYASGPFNGALDEIAIYRRVLSAEEIQTITQRQTPRRAAHFDSRVMTETTGTGAWSSIAWLPQRVVGRELPDYGAAETGYPTGMADMTGNVLLLHLNEPGGSSAFLDASGQGNDGYCYGVRCPTAGIGGRFKRALHFDGFDDYLDTGTGPAISNLGPGTWTMWVRKDAEAPGTLLYKGDPGWYDGWWIDFRSATELGFSGAIAGWDGRRYTRDIPGPGEWFHLAVTWDRSEGHQGIRIYINGQEATYSIQETCSFGEVPQTSLFIGTGGQHASGPFNGTLDEIAIFDRILSPNEIRDHYLRGALRMSFQVRSCAHPSCDAEPFVGPDRTQGTTYSEFINPELAPPAFGLNVANNHYIQYRVYMDADIPTYSPELISVTVQPRLNCSGIKTVTCTLATRTAPLLPHTPITITLPITVVDGSSYPVLTNTAKIKGWESDHCPGDNEGTVATAIEPIPLTGIHISGPTTGQVDTSYTFTATVQPSGALAETYTWQATDQAETDHGGGPTDAITFAWATGGTKSITVTATGDGGAPTVSGDYQIEIRNPVPTLSAISPTTTTAGGPAFTLTVTGTNFVDGSIVRWGGADHTTVFVSGTRLMATISAGDIAAAGSIAVTVFNPAPGGGESAALTFTVENPVPTITAISPAATTAGGPAFTLTVTGTNFIDGSVVQWGGAARTTAFVSSTQLTATITAGDIASAGTATVTVFNPAPGGGVSNGRTFTVENPVPTITAISPATTTAGGPALTLTVTGTGFIDGSVVQWGGAARTTAFVSTTQLTATITAGDIGSAGTVTVTVLNPAPGGGVSNGRVFTVENSAAARSLATIENPVPTISSMSPVTAAAGGPAFTLTVTGTGFVAGSVVQWDGAARTTAFVSTTQLTATVPAEDITAGGTITVTVFNPTPGGGDSPPETFTIYTATRASYSPHGVATSMPARSAEIAGLITLPGVTSVTLRPGLRCPSVLDGEPSPALFPGRRQRFVVGASAP